MKRNRQLMITGFLMLFTFISYGQPVANPNKTSFGLKGGVNLSTIGNEQTNIVFSPDISVGANAGIFLNIHFGFRNQGSAAGTGWFGIQPELLFSQQGFSLGEESITFNYLCLPILAKLYITKELNIEAGPYFSYMINTSPNSTLIGDVEIETENLRGSKDVGLTFGASYETKLGLLVDVRYNYGLSEVASNLMWKNQVIAVSFGWMF